jgi:hypothetical protein
MSRTGVAVAVLAIIVGACGSSQSSGPLAEQAAPVIACTSVNDCQLPQYPMFSCLDRVCAFSDGTTSIVDCTDAKPQLIEASNYDQSCKTDSDCVAVSEGNACAPGFLNCPSVASNVDAMPQYNADVAMTNAAICVWFGDCALSLPPCCRGGTCQTGGQCGPVLQGGTDAAADAGAE